MSSKRFFDNPFVDWKNGSEVCVPEGIKTLTQTLTGVYVEKILVGTLKNSHYRDRRGDLYVGDAGIAYMFLKLAKSPLASSHPNALDLAKEFLALAREKAIHYHKREAERCSFLCGNAGIYAVSAAINHYASKKAEFESDLVFFSTGFEICTRSLHVNDYGSDEVLFGRAGFLSGAYWLNQQIDPKPIANKPLTDVCETIIESGRQYSTARELPIALMYKCYGDQYLGAAHGVSAILHMLLESPLFDRDGFGRFTAASSTKLRDVKESIDYFLSLQDDEGNFPAAMDELGATRSHHLVHWCHGAPGAVYVLAKAYLLFDDPQYLEACRRSAELVWRKGLLKKGPGICHGVTGNGYVFLLMYRLTKEEKYLYRAIKFAEFLTSEQFLREAKTPDHPFSLYEGLAGTVCFLLDLLEPDKAAFPFMDVFGVKFVRN